MNKSTITSELVERVERKVAELKRRGTVDVSARLVEVAELADEEVVIFVYEKGRKGDAVVWRVSQWRKRLVGEASLLAGGSPNLLIRATRMDFELERTEEAGGEDGNHLR